MAILDHVERFSIDYATSGSGDSSDTLTTTLVDTAKSVTFPTMRSSSPDAQAQLAVVYLASTTGVTANRASGTNGALNIVGYVAEWDSGVVVERGATTPAAPNNITLTSITDITKAFVIPTARNTTGTAYGEDENPAIYLWLDSGTPKLNVTFGLNTGLATVQWQVVQYDDCVVQRGGTSLSSGASSVSVAITAVDRTKSFVNISYVHGNSTSNQHIGEILLRARFTADDEITIDRGDTGVAITSIRWEVVEFTDGTKVQEVLSSFSIGDFTNDETIDAVSANAVAFPSSLFRFGKASYISNDTVGESSFTADLTTSTNLQLIRLLSNGTADVAVYVIDFEPPDVLDEVDNEAILEWSIQAFAAEELVVEYAIRNFTSNELVLEWSVQAFASNELVPEWSIQAFASNELVVEWSIQAFAAGELVPEWSIQAFASEELVVEYAIRNHVAAELEIGWGIVSYASSELEMSYDIETAPGLVSATLDIQWGIQAYVSSNILIRWKLLGLDSEVLASPYILTLPDRRATPAINTPRVALVYADSVADARAMAKAEYAGDPDVLWDQATASEAAPDGDLSGWAFRVSITSPAGVLLVDETVRPKSNYTVTAASLVSAGSGYSEADVLTVDGGQGESATITVSTVDGGGEILTFTVSDGGDYTVAPTADGNEPTISDSGSGASFDLTLRTGHSIDAMGAAMVAALNEDNDIAGASYNASTNVLTVAASGDNLGACSVIAGVYPPLLGSPARTVTRVAIQNGGFEDLELADDALDLVAPGWVLSGAAIGTVNLASSLALVPEGVQLLGSIGSGTGYQVLSETFVAGAEYVLRVAVSDNTATGFVIQRYRVQLLSEDPAEPGSLDDAVLLAEDDSKLVPFEDGEIKYTTVRYKAAAADHGRRIVIGLRNYDLSVPDEVANVGFDDVSLHVRYPNLSRNAVPGFVSSVTHEGSASAALTVTLAADDFVMPKILAVGRSV